MDYYYGSCSVKVERSEVMGEELNAQDHEILLFM